MGKKKPQNGRGGRGSRRRGPPRDVGGQQQQQQPNRLELGGPGTASRLLLTHVVREGALWEVFVAATAAQRAAATVRLEFVHRVPGREPVRYSRPVSGPLLEALHRGGPLSRAELEHELEQAIRDAAQDDAPPLDGY
jgi:hypothetical protein